jgi:hypothetical protein
MDLGGANWAILTIVGPLLLAAMILWALLRNRKAKTGNEVERSERATHDLYDAEETARRESDEGIR